MPHKTILSLALALALAAPALAQPAQDAESAAARGQTSLTYNNSRPTLAAADKTPLQAKAIRLRDMILATPALADPRGFGLSASAVLERPVASRAGDPDMAWGNIISRRIVVSRSRPDAAGRYPGDGEGPMIRFAINKLDFAFGRADPAGFYELPQGVQAQPGMMRFPRSGSDYVLITPPGMLAYVPVSIGEYLRSQADFYQKDGTPELVARINAALAPLSPAEQAMPYCMSSQFFIDELRTRCSHRTARPMVRLNPALKAGSGAATKARIIVLSSMPLSKTGDDQERRRLLTAFSQLDMNAVQALLKD